MKGLFKKNQIVVTSLAMMIAAAGYLNYSDRIFGGIWSDESMETANQEHLDISLESGEADITETPGEALLTSGEVSGEESYEESGEGSSGGSGYVAAAKVTREQVRAKNKETLMAIIDNANLSDAQKEEAVAEMIAQTQIAEQEAAVESLLLTKGFSEVVVNITETGADVVVNRSELTEANRAQIEDIITRKTEIAPENIVITPVSE